jgi:hypothetical protein
VLWNKQLKPVVEVTYENKRDMSKTDVRYIKEVVDEQ